MILAQARANGGDAFRQGDVGQVNDLADFHPEHVHFDVLGDLLPGRHWTSMSVAWCWTIPPWVFSRRGLGFVDEVDGHVNLEILVSR